jgi:hypothetical protein
MLQRSRFLGLTSEARKLAASLKGEASDLGSHGVLDIAVLPAHSFGTTQFGKVLTA